MADWRQPRELGQIPPRTVRPNRTSKNTHLFCIIAFLLLPFLELGPTYQSSAQTATLQQRGVAARANLINIDVQTTRHGSQIYTLEYTYRPDGSSDAIHGHSPAYNPPRLRIGDSIPILYDPLHPAVSQANFDDYLHTTDAYKVLRIVGGIVACTTLLPVLILIAFWAVKYKRDKYLLQYGRAAAATIIGEKEYSAGRGGMATAVTYSFVDSNGVTVQSVRNGLPIRNARQYSSNGKLYERVMDNPTVLYDPNDSSRNLLYPSVYAEVVSSSAD